MRQVIHGDAKRRGDTLIEVMLAISIFAMVAMVAINLMNNGINTMQRTLETEMARNEIDAQADAIRYIHNNYVAERNLDDSQFKKAWKEIMNYAITKDGIKDMTANDNKPVYFDINGLESCEDAYGSDKHLGKYHAFVINPRLLIPNNFSNDAEAHVGGNMNGKITYLGKNYDDVILKSMIVSYGKNPSYFASPSLFPRTIYDAISDDSAKNENDRSLSDEGVLYQSLARAEGIWVTVAGNTNNSNTAKHDYYDFYIRTCWHSAGTRVPSTITTVVRLYNPEVLE